MLSATRQAHPEAGAQRTLEGVACMPLFGLGYDSQKRRIDFPVNTARLEELQQFVSCFLGCEDPATKRRDNLPGNP